MLHQLKAICLEELQGKALPPHPAIDRLAKRLDKKFDLSPDDEQLLATRCRDDFLETNSRVRLPMATGDLQEMIFNEARQFIYECLESYTSSICGVRGCTLDFHALRSMWAYGPRSAYGIEKSDMLTKYMNGSVTEKCLPYAKAIVLSSLNVHSHNLQLKVVRGSKFSTVPKNVEKRRNIAVEPSLNMAVQRAAGIYLENALRASGLDIKTQQVFNKHLAYLGSIYNDLATLDCKNASDMISPALVKALFPLEWYEFLCACRSECILIDGNWHKLNMISTMGNGFTFPLMTFIFASMLVACERVINNAPRKWLGKKMRYGVFGDDCIVPISIVDVFLTTMVSWGFDVNFDKSYVDGPFRESCGGDFYAGIDVTPFYIRSLREEQDVYTAINQVTLWSLKTGILLRKTVMFLKSLIPSRKRLYVPFYEAHTAGIFSPNRKDSYDALQAIEKKLRRSVKCTEGAYPFVSKVLIDLAIQGYVRVERSDFSPETRVYSFHVTFSDPLNAVFDYVKLSRSSAVVWTSFSEEGLTKQRINNRVRWQHDTFVRVLTDEQINLWKLLHN